jgi:hypothetical protein
MNAVHSPAEYPNRLSKKARPKIDIDDTSGLYSVGKLVSATVF